MMLEGRMQPTQVEFLAGTAGLDRRDAAMGGWVDARKASTCHLENEDVDLAIRSEGGGEEVTVEEVLRPSPKMMLSRASIMRSEFPITPTWHANCQGVRPGRSARGLPKRL
jgi:hypothetical protein